ncbi:hypothetical protein ACLOJK_023683 [Asimina triloba]
MGRGGFGKNSNYEDLRNARIAENQARLASIGLENAATELLAIISSRKSFKTPTRKYEKTVYDFTSLRRSDRLRRKPADPTPTPTSTPTPTTTTTSSGEVALSSDPLPRRLPTKITEDVEKQRPANAPLVSIRRPQRQESYPNLQSNRLSPLYFFHPASQPWEEEDSAKTATTKIFEMPESQKIRKSFKTPTRKYEKTVYDFTSLCRSDRLRRKPADPTPTPASTPTPTPTPTTTSSGKIALSSDPLPRRLPTKITEDVEKQRPANAPLVSIRQPQRLPPHVLARRCDSKSRGSVYDSVWGICCHFCRFLANPLVESLENTFLLTWL